MGVGPPYATVVALVFPVLAVGWENRLDRVQLTGVIGPVALGFGALLVMPDRGGYGRRDLAVSLLLVVGLMCSGVGVTMTVVVAIAVFLRRGWRVTAAILSIPVVVYGTWYVLEGTEGQRNTVAFSTAIRELPEFAWLGLTGAVSGLTRVPGTGAIVLVLVVAWLGWRARPRHEPWPLVLATAVGAVASVVLTGLRRAGLDAEASRYADIIVVLLLPTIVLATQDVGRMAVRRFGRPLTAVFTVVVAGFLVAEVVGIDHEVQSELFVGEMRPRVLATVKILRDGEPIASTNILGIPFLAEPSTSTIDRLHRHGELPDLDVSRADVLTADVRGGGDRLRAPVSRGARHRGGRNRGAEGLDRDARLPRRGRDLECTGLGDAPVAGGHRVPHHDPPAAGRVDALRGEGCDREATGLRGRTRGRRRRERLARRHRRTVDLQRREEHPVRARSPAQDLMAQGAGGQVRPSPSSESSCFAAPGGDERRHQRGDAITPQMP